MSIVGSLAHLLIAVAGLTVQGQGRDGCPTAAEVSSRLGALLPGDSGGEPEGALLLDSEGGALRVRLVTPRGGVREERTLDLRGSCAELADAVATVAVAWQASLSADDVPPPVLSAREVETGGAGEPVRERSVEVRVGVHTAAGTQRWAPGLTLGGLAPLVRGISWALELTAHWPRSEMADGKSWTWMQLALVAAPSFRVDAGSFLLDLRAGVGLDLAITTSQALYVDESYRLLPLSAAAGLRITHARASYLPWFSLSFSSQLGELVSPVRGAFVQPERWVLGLALGATFPVERFR